MENALEAARRLVEVGDYAAAHPLVSPLVQLAIEPVEATLALREAAYLALRSLPDEHDDAKREYLERWLLGCASAVIAPYATTDQVLHAVGMSALLAGRAGRALRSFARALRGGRLGGGARARVVDRAATALMDLGRNGAARLLAVREQSRAPHEMLGWLFMRRAALASLALGEAEAAADYARRCVEHPFFPATMRSELEPLLERPPSTG